MRLDLGYQDMDQQYPFVVAAYQNLENEDTAFHLANTSEIVILGASPRKYVSERIKCKKLTFHYSERLNKHGLLGRFSPTTMYYRWNKIRGLDDESQFLLCAGNYVAGDYDQIGCFSERMLKWGYFPEYKSYEKEKIIHQDKPTYTILWAGRLIDWKHPEYVIDAAGDLKQRGVSFHLNVVGDGELRGTLEKQIIRENLQDHISVLGSKSPDKVRTFMTESDIFLATSDFQEGWGAVINEAMNSGCAVIASHAMGAAGFLIDHGKNGLIFESDNTVDFLKKLTCLTEDKMICSQLGWSAYQTIAGEWNAEAAANRFLQMCETLIHHETKECKTGPCSPALPISPKQFLRTIRTI